MDKNSIIGIVLIFAILVVFSIVNQPSQEQIEAARQRRDSIAQVEAEQARMVELQQQQAQESKLPELADMPDSLIKSSTLQEKIDQFGIFGPAAIGEQEFYTLENNLIRIKFSNKGGRIYSVELKNYRTHDSLPLMLFDGDETLFGLNFFAQNRSIQTDQLYFTPSVSQHSIVVNGPEVKTGNEGRTRFNEEHPGGKESVSFKIEVAPGKFLEYVYTLEYNSYLIDFDINIQGMEQYVASNQTYLNFT